MCRKKVPRKFMPRADDHFFVSLTLPAVTKETILEVEDDGGRAFVLQSMAYGSGTVFRDDDALPNDSVKDPNMLLTFFPGEELKFTSGSSTSVQVYGYYLDYEEK